MIIDHYLEREQEQRIANHAAALEYQIDKESIEGRKRQGKEDRRSGIFPVEPSNLFYYCSWAEQYQEYALTEKEKEFEFRWKDIAF